MKTMTASRASKEFGRYLDTAQREPVIVTRGSRPVAVTFSIEDAEILLQARIDAGIASGLEDVRLGRIFELTPESGAAMLEEFKRNRSE